MVPDPKSEEIEIEEKWACQYLLWTLSTPSLFQLDANTFYSNEDAGKLPTETQVSHLSLSLMNEGKSNWKTRKMHQTWELPNYKKT